MESKEELRDKYLIPEKSNINIDSPNISGDLGISNYVVCDLYADFILAEYIDIKDGYVKDSSGLYVVENTKQAWRRAIVRVVSPVIAKHGMTKVGDIVVFPNDHGLKSGKISYKDENGVVHTGKNCVFLSEYRIFGKLKENDKC